MLPPIASFALQLQKTIAGKKVLFLSHAHPDLDTLASAYVLQKVFLKSAKAVFGIPEKPLIKFQALLDAHGFSPQIISTLEGFDLVVCVDFRSPSQAGELEYALKQFAGKLIIIDHHSPSSREFSRVYASCIVPAHAATAQIVAELAGEWNFSLEKEDAALLATALILDSYRFAVANSKTFQVMHDLLLQSQQTYESLLMRAFPVHDLNERLTTIKSMQSPQLISAGDYLLAIARAPYASAVASNTLVQLGADIGIGLFRSREFVTASLRLSSRAHSVLGMDAVEILLPLAKSHGGVCGGHASAAQITLPGYASENVIEDTFKRELFSLVKKIQKNAQLKVH